VEQWPEILSDIKIIYVPIGYVNTLVISFDNGKEIFIDVVKTKNNSSEKNNIEKSIKNFIETYNEEIVDIDFSINVEKIKTESQEFTKKFLENQITP